MNIFEKLIELKQSVGGFTKDKKSYGYDYVSGSQILKKIKGKMSELGLFLYPEVDFNTFEWEKYEYINSKGEAKVDFIVTFQLTYNWVNAEDPTENFKVPWIALGQQTGDIAKAGGTALTYNERYFLLKTFGLPTDIDDADNRPLTETNGTWYTGGKGSVKDKDIVDIFAIGEGRGLTRPQILAGCLKDYKKGIEKLNKAELKQLKEKISAYEPKV